MKIAFYEATTQYTERERVLFQNEIKLCGIPFFSKKEDLLKVSPLILFYHGNDEADLKKTIDGRGNKAFHSQLSETWLVEFGGDNTQIRSKTNPKQITYINFRDLQKRWPTIKNKIESATDISKEILLQIVFGFDPILEELLEKHLASDLNGTKYESYDADLERIKDILLAPKP